MSNPYNSTATKEQQHIIKQFFGGYSVKQLADMYRKEHKVKLADAYHIVGEALMHITWV